MKDTLHDINTNTGQIMNILIGKTMKYMSMPSIVAKAITCLLLSTAGITLSHGQTNDSIAHTMLVADYDYTCQTSNAKGEELKVSYGLTLQVAQDMACTMGRKRHSGENDMSERLLYAPVTWQNYPQGKMTSIETIPPYQYLTSEAMPQLKWKRCRPSMTPSVACPVRRLSVSMVAGHGRLGLPRDYPAALGHGD